MKTLLIVEDDLELQQIYKAKLGGLEYEVNLAQTVIEAEQSIGQKPPDLILLDIMLPGGQNGFDLLEKLKSQPKLKNIPVVVLTNLDSEEKVATEIGVVKYMVKAKSSIGAVVDEVQKLLSAD